jgi:hypothetical protein
MSRGWMGPVDAPSRRPGCRSVRVFQSTTMETCARARCGVPVCTSATSQIRTNASA